MECGSYQKQQRVFAARKIQTYWRSRQDRQMFQLMTRIVRAAEHCLASTVLRQLSPREADLVKDPSMQCKVRFRFSGSQFPPAIVFKIFRLGGGGQYISGKRVFRPSNAATAETCRMMGSRVFFNHVLADEVLRQGRTVVDTSDITCMRDYMQYSSHLDELPAYLGGRVNSWRSLSLQGLSETVLQRGCWEAEGKSAVADRLRQELLLCQEGGGIPRMLRSPAVPPSSDRPVLSPGPVLSTRRSARACCTAARMRQLYLRNILREENQERNCDGNKEPVEDRPEKHMTGGHEKSRTPQIIVPQVREELSSQDSLSESEWEEEAEKLYSWTRQLDMDDIDTVAHTEYK